MNGGTARGVGPQRTLWLCVAAIVVLAALARIAVVLRFPYLDGDWILYRIVAQNILRGCGVSASPVYDFMCVPHFGGNHFPGYPAFVALVWRLFAHSNRAVLVVQSLIAALAVGWLTVAVARYSGRLSVAVLAGTLLAVSPSQIAWAGSGLTETLELAATTWIFAELLLSHAAGRMRVFPLGYALAAACFLRIDGVLLSVPIALSAWLLSSSRVALQNLVVIGLIAAAPMAGWFVRNAMVGLPSILPSPWVLPDGSRGPMGYLAWVDSWMTTSQERSDATFFDATNYSKITIAPTAYGSDAERIEVEELMKDLRAAEGQPFPPAIDAAFAALAKERTAQHPVLVRVVLPLERAVNLSAPWIWPVTAFRRFAPTPTDLYRSVLTLSFLVAGGLSFRRDMAMLRPVVSITLCFVVVRIVLLAAMGDIDVRYTVYFAPFFEVLLAMSVGLAVAAWTGPPLEIVRK